MSTPRWIRVLAAMVLLTCLVAALVPDQLSHADPGALVGEPYAPPGRGHRLGTDGLGRDVAARLVWGARPALVNALGVVSVALAASILLGVVATVLGGPLSAVARRLTDVVVAIPRLPLLILVGAMVGGNRPALMVALGLLMWAPAARMLRNETLAVWVGGPAQAARALGAGALHLVRHHLLPAVRPLLVAEAITIGSAALLMDAALAYVGAVGTDAITWGAELHRALSDPAALYTPAWSWWALPNGLAITAVTTSLVLLTDRTSLTNGES